MRKVVRWACISLTLLTVLAVVATWAVYQATRQEPKFYREALRIEPARQAEIGDQFEQEVLELRNDSRQMGTWQAVFTAEQVNSWLAVDLPEKFPNALPPGVEHPRIAIDQGLVRVAVRFREGLMTTVLSFALEIGLAEEPNTVAIRIGEVRAGKLPVPIGAWLEKAQERLKQTDLRVRWSQADGDPVALVQIPDRSPENPRQTVSLEAIKVEADAVSLTGLTVDVDEPPGNPLPSPPAIVQRPAAADSGENVTTQR